MNNKPHLFYFKCSQVDVLSNHCHIFSFLLSSYISDLTEQLQIQTAVAVIGCTFQEYKTIKLLHKYDYAIDDT